MVDRTLKDDDGRVIGVSVRVPEGDPEEDGELRASLVVLADGANSLLAEADGLKQPLDAGQTALGVKETLGLARERIDERFAVSGEQGVAWDVWQGFRNFWYPIRSRKGNVSSARSCYKDPARLASRLAFFENVMASVVP